MAREMVKEKGKWAPRKTLKVVSRINYWDNFQKTHSDKSPIKSIIASDPIIRKICTFCYPAILRLSDLRQYSFNEKISEIDSITEEEITHLGDKLNLSSGLDREWLRFVMDVFRVTKNTVRVKDALSKSGNLSEEQVLQGVSSAYSTISMKDIITLRDIHGKEEFLIRMGKFWPSFILEYHSRQNEGSYEVCINIHHLFKSPSKEEIETKFDWDGHSGEIFVRYLGDDIKQLFKDVTQYQSDSAKKAIMEMALHGKDNYTIQHFFGGKPILDQPFVYQIGKRYEALLKATVRDASQTAFDNSGEKWGEDVSSMGSIWESFVKTLRTFDSSKGRLASHLKLGLKFHPQNYYEKYTETLKREHSGGSLDDFIKPDDEEVGRRIDSLIDEDILDPESTLIIKNALEKAGGKPGYKTMTPTERKRKERKIKKAKKEFEY